MGRRCRTGSARVVAGKSPCKNGSRSTGVLQLHSHQSRYTVPLRCPHDFRRNPKRWFSKRVVLADVPPERKPERVYVRMFPRNEKTGTRVRSHVPPERKPEQGHIRQNHPFTKPPFYLPVRFHESMRCTGAGETQPGSFFLEAFVEQHRQKAKPRSDESFTRIHRLALFKAQLT